MKLNPTITDLIPFKLSPSILATNQCIVGIPFPLIRSRMLLFKSLDKIIDKIMKVVTFNSQNSLLDRIFSSCRAAISTEIKSRLLKENVIEKLNDSGKVDLQFNRFKANIYHNDPTASNGESLLSQLTNQLPEKNIDRLRTKSSPPWHVDLIGEGATDAGGPGRDLFSETCMEVMHPSLSLFVPTPNTRVDPNASNQLIPMPAHQISEKIRLEYMYSGVLMGLCYSSKLPEPFKFARFVWNFLSGRNVTIEDIYEIDTSFRDLIVPMEDPENEKLTEEEFEQRFPRSFTCQDSLGHNIELIPGGTNTPVTLSRRLEYVQRCKKLRLKEFDVPLQALREGFNKIFNPSVASLLAPWELELFICGDTQCPIAEMKKCCSYESSDPTAVLLWKVLETFTPQERMLFIKFGCGRMGLPPPGMEWTSRLQISFSSSSQPDPLKPLPTAATCSNSMTIPKYQTEEWMAKKLRAAILFGADIDRDHDARISDLAGFT